MYLNTVFMILITIINGLDERLDLSSINGMSDSFIPMLAVNSEYNYENQF